MWTAELEFNVWSEGTRVVESADERVIVGGHALGRDEVTAIRAGLHDDRPAVLLEGSVPDPARLVIQCDEQGRPR